MDIQHHARTAQIKKLSRILRIAFTWIGFLIWFLYPLALMPFFVDARVTLDVRDANTAFPLAALSWPVRIAMSFGIALTLYFAQQLVLHARTLMMHFQQGEIFNAGAIAAARSALANAQVLFWLNVLAQTGMMFLKAAQATHPVYRIDPDLLIYGFLFFGVMYLMLWALEIGRDLHEESVLTV